MMFNMFKMLFPELRSGVGQPEDSGGQDEGSAPRFEQRCVAAQEEPLLSQQELPSTLQRIPDGRGRADRSRQESVGLAGQVDASTLCTHSWAGYRCEQSVSRPHIIFKNFITCVSQSVCDAG